MTWIFQHRYRIIIALLGVSIFIGMWHAFPLRFVVFDEMFYVGSVLKALSQHTLLPQGTDVPYGTLTYLFNFALIVIFLAGMLPWYGFDLERLTHALTTSPEIVSWIPRLASALVYLALLVFFKRFFDRELGDRRLSTILLVLLFTNMITAIIFHTGKVWVLSTALVLFSFYFLYRAMTEQEEKRRSRHALTSIVASFLAVANFPIMAFGLINVPAIAFAFRRNRRMLLRAAGYVAAGVLAAGAVAALNAHGITSQIRGVFENYLLSPEAVAKNLSFVSSLGLYLAKIALLFPLHFIAIVYAARAGIRNKKLFHLSLAYGIAYLLTIAVTARWAVDFHWYFRYLFPFGFFLTLLLASFNLRPTRFFYGLAGVSLIYFFFTLYYLSVPTTFNQARTWVTHNLNDPAAVIVNRVQEVEFPLNRASAAAMRESECGVLCRAAREKNLNAWFSPLILDSKSATGTPSGTEHNLFFLEERTTEKPGRKLLASFGVAENDDAYFSVEYNAGNYFLPSYFTARRFGKNLYLYEATATSPVQ